MSAFWKWALGLGAAGAAAWYFWPKDAAAAQLPPSPTPYAPYVPPARQPVARPSSSTSVTPVATQTLPVPTTTDLPPGATPVSTQRSYVVEQGRVYAFTATPNSMMLSPVSKLQGLGWAVDTGRTYRDGLTGPFHVTATWTRVSTDSPALYTPDLTLSNPTLVG